ncbi:MAG TPA: anti-sigma factor [Gemmatimonadales bacterium]|nr:anti-sigma factor [Gemmatimonadales bacterium]
MSDWLGMAAAPRTPRPELKDRVLRRAQSARRMRWSMLAAAALVGALAGGGLFWSRAARLEGNLAAARDTLDLLRQPGGRVLLIPVTTAGRPGAMTVYADSLTRRWLITCHHLTPNLPSQAYQLWFLTGSEARPAGVMPMDHDVPMVMTLEVPAGAGKVTGLAMSVEPRAGSKAPTGALVFRVEL